MAAVYEHKPDLLKRYLELDQGGKVQAECKSHLLPSNTISSVRSLDLQLTYFYQTFGSTVMVVSVAKPR